MSTTIQPKMCAVCYIVLDQSGDGWIHTRELVGKSDHIAVPVDYNAAHVHTMCDFCYDEVLKPDAYTVPASNFQMPVIPTVSAGNWAACAACAYLVRTGDWNGLTDRATEMYLKREPGSRLAGGTIHEWLGQSYEQLRQHMTGPVRPWEPGDEEVSV